MARIEEAKVKVVLGALKAGKKIMRKPWKFKNL